MNQPAHIHKAQEAATQQWFQNNPWAASRGLDEPTWNALRNTIYPGCKDESILMAVDYCRARGLDIMLKPVHLVPMQVKDAQTGQKAWRDVPMPGIGMYRIQASRSGDEAGHDEPEFGPTIEQEFDGSDWNKNPVKVKVRYPEWCKYTVYKVIGERIVAYTAKEFWLENYAAQSAKDEAPNAMWKKRPFAQLAKCAEAQALRKGWPEIGQEPTAEEMEGKGYERDMGPVKQADESGGRPSLPEYPQERLDKKLPEFKESIENGTSAEDIVGFLQSKYVLSDDQVKQIHALEEGETA